MRGYDPALVTTPARLLFALALLCALPCAAQAQDWMWAEGKTVQTVTFKGLRRLHKADAQAMISTRPDKAFDPHELAKDVARLYRSERFGSPGPGQPPVKVEVFQAANQASVRIVFTLHERLDVRRVRFEGSSEDAFSESELLAMIRSEAGKRHDPFTVELDARKILSALREKGHLLAQVTHSAVTAEGASDTDVIFTIHPGPQIYVNCIIYEGAEQLDPSVIEDAAGPDAMETKERAVFGFLEQGVYKPDALKRDLDRIARYYRSQGFLDARVYKKEERFAVDGTSLDVVIGIEEGERYTIRRVGVEGTKVVDGDRLLDKLDLKPGRPFLGEDLRKSVDAVRHVYGQRAYVHTAVDVDVRYDIERHLLDIILRVNEGPKVRIEKIRIEGNEKTQEKVIRRELTFYPGEYFDADEVEDSLARLGRLRFFNDVRVDFAPGPAPGREDLILRVDEARTGSFVLGGGISTSAGFFGNISLAQRNFDIFDWPASWRDFVDGHSLTGAGQSFSLTLRPGADRSDYSIDFVEPYLFDLPVLFGVELAAHQRFRSDYTETRLNTRIKLGYRLLPDLMVRADYRIERVRISSIDPGSLPDVFDVSGTSWVSALRVSLTYNRNRFDTKDFVVYGGYKVSSYYELAGGALLGDFDFHRVGLEGQVQWSPFSWPGHHKWVLKFGAEAGYQHPFGPSESIPIFERFYAGGPNSIRGFQVRSVGPQVNGEPLGGYFQLLTTTEFSFPLFMDLLRGVVFVDAGTVNDGRDFDHFEHQMRVAAGLGFRIRIPVFPAPVALDFAWPIYEQDDDDTQVFSFSVGFGF
jgi:outer membrane protein insertion porin family